VSGHLVARARDHVESAIVPIGNHFQPSDTDRSLRLAVAHPTNVGLPPAAPRSRMIERDGGASECAPSQFAAVTPVTVWRRLETIPHPYTLSLVF
jgi:hypothetical protein